MKKINILLIICILICFPDISLSARQYTQSAFSPSPDAVNLIQRNINNAKKNIYIAAYSFSSAKVSDALINAHKRGVKVQVLLDKTNVGKRTYPAVEALYRAGIPVRINRKYAIMHNKYIIIDKITVQTGSFNFTASAEKRNAENVIVIRNNPALAKRYLTNWKKLWDEGEEY